MNRKLWAPPISDDLSDFLIWLLNSKAIHWLILLNAPYFIILSPIIDYVAFKWLHFVVRNFYGKATQGMSEIGTFLIFYMNITFWIQILFLGLWYIFPRDHNCGPIENGQYGWQPVEEWIEATNILKQIYIIITFYPILWNIALFLVLLTTFNRNKA